MNEIKINEYLNLQLHVPSEMCKEFRLELSRFQSVGFPFLPRHLFVPEDLISPLYYGIVLVKRFKR